MTTKTTETVSVKTPYWDIAADIYFPPGFDESKQYPAIISAHPIGSCKEQTSGNVYGTALADAGYVVIAFDASFQGASGGEPRFTEDPTQRVQDFSFVVDHLVTLPYVDADRIGVLGICGGGGYSISAAKTERRIKVVGSVVGVNFGHLLHEAFSGYEPIATLEAIAGQRTAEVRGAEPNVENLLPPTVDAAAGTGLDVVEATDYYKTPRGEKPNGATRSLISRRAAGYGWDAFTHAKYSSPSRCVSSSETSPVRSVPTVTASRSTAAPAPRRSSSSWPKASRTTTCTTSPSPSRSPSTP
jgi:fermentation-respiration switch protein FrsA (DUF1100 family)